jgi:hypothetical protein
MQPVVAQHKLGGPAWCNTCPAAGKRSCKPGSKHHLNLSDQFMVHVSSVNGTASSCWVPTLTITGLTQQSTVPQPSVMILCCIAPLTCEHVFVKVQVLSQWQPCSPGARKRPNQLIES